MSTSSNVKQPPVNLGQPQGDPRPPNSIPTQLRAAADFFVRPWYILRGYRSVNLRPDLIAALTVAFILLPQAIAFALIAELPPQFGLYTAIVASIVGGLWGSSHQLQTGPTNTISLLTLSALLAVAVPGSVEYFTAARLLAIMVGLIILVLGLARLGVLVNFISDSVIVGFTAGAGILIIVNQLRYLFGIGIPSYPALIDTLQSIGVNISEMNRVSLGIGLMTIIIILLIHKINPKLPGALIAIVIASFFLGFFGLSELNIRTVSELPTTLPPLQFHKLDPQILSQLSTKALAVAAIALIESTSIARVISSQTRQRLDSNQEFVGQGLANLASGVFSGYPAAGSFTRSAVSFQSGARTSLASVFAGVMVLFATLILGGWVIYIPLAALAGVLIVTAVRLIDFKEISRIWQGSRGDRLIMAVTLIATLTIPLEFAVLIGVAMSLIYYLLQTITPRVRPVLPDESFEYLVPENGRDACPQLGVVEILGDLYFGAVHHVEEVIEANLQRHPSQRYLLMRILGVENIDISGIHALEGILEIYRERGGDVFIGRYKEQVREFMKSSGFVDQLGEDHFLPRDENAIGRLFYTVLDPAICIYECPYRAFKECQNLPKRLDMLGESPHLDIINKNVRYISAHSLWSELHSRTPPTLIDVREPREFKRGHIPEAQLISLPDIIRGIRQVPRDDPVVLVCRGGRRSTRIACMLHEKGYDNIRALDGGMLSWSAANLLEAVEYTRPDHSDPPDNIDQNNA